MKKLLILIALLISTLSVQAQRLLGWDEWQASKSEAALYQTAQDLDSLPAGIGMKRFLSIDPLARQFPFLTPYQFAENTPFWGIDLDGLELSISTTLESNKTWQGAYKKVSSASKIHKYIENLWENYKSELKEDVATFQPNIGGGYQTREIKAGATKKEKSFFGTEQTVVSKYIPSKGLIAFNSRYLDNTIHEQIIQTTIAEETFHAGQAIFYGTLKESPFKTESKYADFRLDVEARVYRAFIGTFLGKKEQYIKNFAEHKDVQIYFNLLREGKNPNEEQEKAFRERVKILGQDYYKQVSPVGVVQADVNSFVNSGVPTKFFDSLTKDLKLGKK